MKIKVDADIAVARHFRVRAAFTCDSHALAILGPSGSGKSTLLAGMLGVRGGCRFVLNGEDLSDVPVHRRRLAYVPQDALLFPHMSVAANIGYGGASPAQIAEVADALGISRLLDRAPRNLSGGERKRVALARAVAIRPRAIFLDEPFTGLDDVRKRDAMSLLSAVVKRYDIPVVLVSHVADEAIALTEHAVVLQEGRVAGEGPTPQMVYKGDLRFDNFLVGEVVGRRAVAVDGFVLHAAMPDDVAGTIRLSCPAHDILLARERPHGISAQNIWTTRITSLQWVGEDALVYLEHPALRAIVTRQAVADLGLAPGAAVCAIVKATSLVFLGTHERLRSPDSPV